MLRHFRNLRLIHYSSIRRQQLILTDRAIQRLKNVAKDGESLRIMVEGGGCSGFEYKLSLDKHLNEDDEIIEKDGVKVIIDKV